MKRFLAVIGLSAAIIGIGAPVASAALVEEPTSDGVRLCPYVLVDGEKHYACLPVWL